MYVHLSFSQKNFDLLGQCDNGNRFCLPQLGQWVWAYQLILQPRVKTQVIPRFKQISFFEASADKLQELQVPLRVAPPVHGAVVHLVAHIMDALPSERGHLVAVDADLELPAVEHEEHHNGTCFDLPLRRINTLPHHDVLVLDGLDEGDLRGQPHLLPALAQSALEHALTRLEVAPRQHPGIRIGPQLSRPLRNEDLVTFVVVKHHACAWFHHFVWVPVNMQVQEWALGAMVEMSTFNDLLIGLQVLRVGLLSIDAVIFAQFECALGYVPFQVDSLSQQLMDAPAVGGIDPALPCIVLHWCLILANHKQQQSSPTNPKHGKSNNK